MEEMSPALAMTLSLGNSMCDNSGIATHVEITRLKLVTGTASLLSDSGKVVSEESLSGGAESCSHAKNELNLASMTTPDDGVDGETVLLNMLLENKNGSITSDAVIQETGEDEVLSVVEDSSGIIPKGILVLNAASEISLPKSVKMENTKIIAKAIIVESINEVQVPTAKLLIGAVSPNAEISDGSDIKASAVLLKLPSEKNLIGGPTRSVYELDCIPLWGSVSICGRRSEMEDAVAAVPRFAKVPIKMLIGDRVVDGISESLTHLTSHFYGVYDGHGGPSIGYVSMIRRRLMQVANYCRDRIHLALAEEFGNIKNNSNDGIIWGDQQLQWEKAFSSCFHKVDDEIGGKSIRGLIEGDGNASISSSEPIAPETVGSTAVVALVCSSHIIVANCGDSRAVLCPWKRPHGIISGSQSDQIFKTLDNSYPEVMFLPRAKDDECLHFSE
ncbi:protein phosphatase 2C 16-like [Populus alba x Populus x berolinensis]|nr:protein phosphatase 2C 16-like [Populus alba x Populus x berolinensis]